jgi:uncharacterized protein (UPF0264 family)
MTGMLASVNSMDEANIVMAANVDIIDLKEPALGALGGLDISLVKKIVAVVNGQCPTSATIGDLPMQPEIIFNAVKEMAETGVNYVKIGFFPGENQEQIIQKLATLTPRFNLIAVLFADTHPDFSLIDSLIAAGFKGVMLDTQDKTKGSLTGMMAKTEIERFVNHVKSRHAICGLAGSLRLEDIPLLMPYQPDYLGFRGALCESHKRAGQLNPQSVKNIKQTIGEFSC